MPLTVDMEFAWEGRRVIPTLLIEGRRTIKTRAFSRDSRYVGDLLNLIRIFSDKQVDEIMIVDRGARDAGIDYDLLAAASAECFAPLAYGGGICNASDAERVVACGVDKVTVTSGAADGQVLNAVAAALGSQSVVAGIDVTLRGGARCVAIDGAQRVLDGTPAEWARRHVEAGAGEVFVNATWLEGARTGYDLELLREVLDAVDVPVTVCGGAGSPDHFRAAFELGAAAAAAGTLFVFFGPLDAVLPTYARPTG